MVRPGRIGFGPMVASPQDAAVPPRRRIEIYLEPRDLWIGVFVARDAIYICPIPVLVVRVARGARFAPCVMGDPWS